MRIEEKRNSLKESRGACSIANQGRTYLGHLILDETVTTLTYHQPSHTEKPTEFEQETNRATPRNQPSAYILKNELDN